MRVRKTVGLLMMLLVLGIGVGAAAPATVTVTIRVEGMDCDGCASSIEKALKATDGVEAVSASFKKKEVSVKYDDQKVSVAKLREVINSTGFKALED